MIGMMSRKFCEIDVGLAKKVERAVLQRSYTTLPRANGRAEVFTVGQRGHLDHGSADAGKCSPDAHCRADQSFATLPSL